MSREIRLGWCNETAYNGYILCHVGIYVNCKLSLLKNTISHSIPKIKVRCMNYQSIPLAFTLTTNTVQLLSSINIIQYMLR
uniref:Uncharacterized protein n=1 Tax=Populus trichocarpa TaxID=3694 RepID=A0A2K1Z0I2_POPTR